MPNPRYDLAVQRRAIEQVLKHRRSVAQVARQLNCSPQSVKNWIDRHRESISAPVQPPPCTTFLPLQVENTELVVPKIELVTKSGLTLRFPVDTRLDTLLGIVQGLEVVPC